MYMQQTIRFTKKNGPVEFGPPRRGGGKISGDVIGGAIRHLLGRRGVSKTWEKFKA